jgi:HK97 family phage major capsid protein
VSPRVTPRSKRTADEVLDLAANRLARGELAEARLERLLLQANRGRSELAEFRSRVVSGERTHAASPDEVWWKYLLAPGVPSPLGGSVYGLDREEHRVLSKATSAAGGYLVPTSLDEQITAARRARAVIGAVSREVVTSDGTPLLFPSTTTHGIATWTAENASYTASDEVFGQVSVGAFKGATQVVVSEELARDAGADFEKYLADELGLRIAMLEETAFAVGDGPGKPLGISTSTNGVATVTAATGSSTGFKLADVNAVWAALPDGYKPNASWIMSPSAFRSLSVLADTAGGLVLPTLHAAEPTLFSRPVYQSADLPAAAANARSVVVGDFSVGYLVRRVHGVAVQRQDEIFSNTGQIGFRAFERLDGRIIVADALRILVNSAT